MSANETPSALTFTAERRRALLDEYFMVVPSLDEVSYLRACASGVDAERLRQHEQMYQRRVRTLWAEYLTGTPVLDVVRCPHTGEVMHYPIDNLGVDGLWWDYFTPARRSAPLPRTFFAVSGALRLTEPPRPAPFLCKPGPEVPYVIPRILEDPAMRAVLVSMRVGSHLGFATFYFADPMPFRLARVNDWGTNDYWFRDAAGNELWNAIDEDESEFDFDLAPWITREKLAWIRPGDPALTLREGVDECPFLNQPGRRTILRIYDGMVTDTHWRPPVRRGEEARRARTNAIPAQR